MAIKRTNVRLSPRVRISSSIANFRVKVLKKTGLPEWRVKDLFHPCVFYGLYHPGDYLRFFCTFGPREVIWCGSDIISLRKSVWRLVIPRLYARHVCENHVEASALKLLGIEAEIRPMIFDDPTNFKDCYQPSQRPHVFLCAQPGREEEYGVFLIESLAPHIPDVTFHFYGIEGKSKGNLVYHGRVPEKQFNEEIKGYHSCCRLNSFDGFGEGVAKCILNGGYPITTIRYPLIAHAPDTKSLILHLRSLKKKKESNPAREYWAKILQ